VSVPVEFLGGDVKLFLSDCREVLPSLAADLLCADPPYGVGLGSHDGAQDRRVRHLSKQGYGDYEDTPENFERVIVPAVTQALEQTRRGMVFGVPPQIWKFPAPDAIGGVFLPSAVGRHCWGFNSFALCLLYGKAAALNTGCRPTGIARTDKAEDTGHPATKPLSWMTWAVSLGSVAGETVLDPFMGSGTTGVAAVRLGRKFIGVELDQQYFEIACRRIEDATRQEDMFLSRAPSGAAA
jgi:site-specific DNA-methyltransferase (adenine-specific)